MSECLNCGEPTEKKTKKNKYKKYCNKKCQSEHNKRLKYGKLKIFTVTCHHPECGQQFEVEEREKSFPKKDKYFCSKNCARSYSSYNKKEQKNKKIRERLSNTIPELICQNCGKKFKPKSSYKARTQKYCSRICNAKRVRSNETRRKISEKVQQRIKEGRHNGWQTRPFLSYPEKFFKRVLENNGYKNKFITNYKVNKNDLGMDDVSNYFLDFYFPELNLDLEIDGKRHWKDSYTYEKDKERDYYLKQNGYIVYRIQWKKISTKPGKEYIKDEISKLLNYLKEIEYKTI